ncbi:MAG: hypothetical protein VX032_00300, partial [SAR324 cluster bacterium]|nr:hypothetical protein [SAR324 cluster bacterium]
MSCNTLSTATLANNPKCLLFVDGERNVIDSIQDAFVEKKFHTKVLDRKKWRGAHNGVSNLSGIASPTGGDTID